MVKVIKDIPRVQPPVEKEEKSAIQHAERDINHGPVEETSVIRQYSAFKLPELGKPFKPSVTEPVTAQALEAVGRGSRWDQVWLLWRQQKN